MVLRPNTGQADIHQDLLHHHKADMCAAGIGHLPWQTVMHVCSQATRLYRVCKCLHFSYIDLLAHDELVRSKGILATTSSLLKTGLGDAG